MSLICVKEVGLMDRWGDSLGMCYYDGYLHAVGQAEVAIVASQYHYVFDLNGNVIHKITAPFSGRAESNISLLGGKITCIGSAGGAQDIWQFDPAIAGYTADSWTQINSSFVAAIGNRYMAAGADADGWFWIFGGWNNSTVYKTQNFTDWTFVSNLPTDLDKVSGCGCCVFNGLIYLIGGSTNMDEGGADEFYNGNYFGKVWTFNPATEAFTEVYENQEHFGQIWLDAVATDDYIYVVKGYIRPEVIPVQFPPETDAVGGNNRGLLRSADGVTWESMNLTDGLATLFERHRAGVVAAENVAYILAGFNANDFWKIV